MGAQNYYRSRCDNGDPLKVNEKDFGEQGVSAN